MTVVFVAGALANKPGQSGEAWVKLSWARGLQRLGIDVWFVEQLAESMAEDERALAWFRGVTQRFDLAERAALLQGGESMVGPSVDELAAVAPEATLVNISGQSSSTTGWRTGYQSIPTVGIGQSSRPIRSPIVK